MEHLIDKSALVAEVERHLEYANNGIEYAQMGIDSGIEHCKVELSAWQHCQNMCKQILSFINSLEVKEVDLEEKATQLSQKYFPDEENIWARPNIEAQRCKSACIEIVEWLKAQKGE